MCDSRTCCLDGHPLTGLNSYWAGDMPILPACFLHTVLIWIPCALFFATLPFEILKLRNGKRISEEGRSRRRFLFLVRLIGLLIIFIAADIRVGAIRYVEKVHGTVLSAFILYPITLAGLIIVSIFRHRLLAASSSHFVWITLFTFAIFGLPELMSTIYHVKEGGIHPISSITFFIEYAATILSLITFGINDPVSEKVSTIRPWPEKYLTLPSILVFSWFFKLLVKGYRHTLSIGDVFKVSEDEQTYTNYRNFEENLRKKIQWQGKGNSKGNGTISQWGMIMVLIRTFHKPVLTAAFLQLINAVSVMLSPPILILLMQFARNKDEPNWHGGIYAGVLFAVTVVRSFSNQYHLHLMNKFGIRARAAITAAVYRKALSMSAEARNHSNTGEIMNLMAVDSMRFVEIAPWFQLLWSAIFQVCVGLYFIYGVVGHAMWAGLGVLVIILSCTTVVSKQMQKLQVKQLQQKDKRMKLITEVINGMKLVKLYAWETAFERLVDLIRAQELRFLKIATSIFGFIKVSYVCTNLLACMAIFGVYCSLDPSHNITAEKAFLVITVFNIIYIPFTQLPLAVSHTMMALAAVSRLRKYFCRDDLIVYVEKQKSYDTSSISVKNGTFVWEKDAEPSLTDITFSVKPGQLIAVVGAVGSGKSSLISAICGEMQKKNGQVFVNGSVAYVSQQAWIQNMTVRDNILFGLPYNESRYQEVVRACQLEPDLELLADGDMTVIGERGANLSGGQKQRISMARAVYHNCDVYLLDDPLSAVDVHVGKGIFEKVVGPHGLLKNKARIFVTHGISYLPACDDILVMSKGKILASGSFDELARTQEVFKKFMEENVMAQKEENQAASLDVSGNLQRDSMRCSIRRQESIISTRSEAVLERTLSNQSVTEKPRFDAFSLTPTLAKDLTAPEEDEKPRKGDFKTYWRYIRYGGASLLLHGLFLCACSFAYLAANMWLQIWTDTVPPGDYNYSLPNERIIPYSEGIGVLGACTAIQFIVTVILSIYLVLFQLRASSKIHQQLLQSILRAPVSFFDNTPSGRLTNRFGKDMNTIDNQIPLSLSACIHSFSILVSFAIALAYSAWYLAIVIVPVLVIYMFLQNFYVATSRQLRRMEAVTRSKIYSHFNETVHGVATIRAYNRQNRFEAQSDKLVDVNDSVQLTLLASTRWLGIQLDFVGNLVIVAAALTVILSRETMLPGLVGLSLSCALRITDMMNWGMQETNTLQTEAVAIDRIMDYLETKQEADWNSSDPHVISQIENWPAHGAVEFRDYSTSYQPGLPLVLKAFSCNIRGGEKIGVVGRTGAGKSSLTLALFRLIEPVDGTILIDNVDIKHLGLHELRKKLTIIPQEPVLFSGTLRQNIDPFEEYPDDAIFRALQLSHLTSFVKSLYGGLSHEINEGGANLSVGQRQLLCLARALLKKSKILIMDEATASVDAETDALIQRTVKEQFAESTVITIAHRLNTILDCDRIMVLESGHLKEFDSPNVLIRNSQSEFGRMVKEAGIRIVDDNPKNTKL